MATPRISVYQNDNNINLVFNIKKDGKVESILGATILFQMLDNQSGNIIKHECTITDPSSAECMYTLTEEDLKVATIYQTEIQIIYSNGTKLSYPNPVIIRVLPEIIPN